MKHTEYQDDVYFVVAPEKTEEVLTRVTTIWEEECGLKINHSKTKIWAEDANLQTNLPEGLRPSWSPTMKTLGNRTHIALREGGAALNLGNHTDDDLPKVVQDLSGLQEKIQDLSKVELGVSVGHRLWQYTAMAAVVHLMSNTLYGPAGLLGLSELQEKHLQWVVNRETDNKENLLATLPQKMGGGLGIRDPVPAAATLYIATQSRVRPKIEELLEERLRQ